IVLSKPRQLRPPLTRPHILPLRLAFPLHPVLRVPPRQSPLSVPSPFEAMHLILPEVALLISTAVRIEPPFEPVPHSIFEISSLAETWRSVRSQLPPPQIDTRPSLHGVSTDQISIP